MRFIFAGLFALLALSSIPLLGQTVGTLAGRVTTAAGDPVQRATIRVLGISPARGAVSKADGSYLIAGLRAGTYDVAVRTQFYREERRAGVRINIDSTTTLDVTLIADTTRRRITLPSRRDIPLPGTISRAPGYIERDVTMHRGIRIRGEESTEDIVARHTLPAPRLFPYFDPTAYIIRSGRDQPSGGLERWGSDRTRERATLPWRREQPVIRMPIVTQVTAAADAGLITESPMIRYRPMLSWPHDIVRMDSRSGRPIDDPFSGGFSAYLVSSTEVPNWFYDPAKRDVVEPSLDDRAEWIRRYEERRDMLSPAERQLASWTRRR